MDADNRLGNMRTHWQALGIAVAIEASSLAFLFVHHSRAVAEMLQLWWTVLHVPTILFFRHYLIWEEHGTEILFSVCGVWVMTLQAILWYAGWYWLLIALQNVRAKRTTIKSTPVIVCVFIATLALAATVWLLILPGLPRATHYSGPGVAGNLLSLEVAKARWWAAHQGGPEWPTKADLLPYLGSTNFDQAIRPRGNEIYIINKTGAPVYAYFPKARAANCLMSVDTNRLRMELEARMDDPLILSQY